MLLKHIIGLIRPDRGKIIVDGKDVGRLKRKELSELRSHIGYVFQNGALFDSMNVFENVRLGITDEDKYGDLEYCRAARGRVHPAGQPAARDDRQVSGRAFRAACGSGSASRGRSRAARSTCCTTSRPRGSIRSTPTSSTSLVQRLDDELGVTSVMVTHDVRGAFRVADRLALLSEGKIVHAGHAAGVPRLDEPARCREFLERDFDNPSFAA